MFWIIAESGSSKTDWVILNNNVVVRREITIGINPLFMDENEIKCLLEHIFQNEKNEIERLIFYGAGLSAEKAKSKLYEVFQEFFKHAQVNLNRDIIGAIQCATFEEKDAIIGILGTGSNTCVYKDNNQIQITETLGYVLGDEGSGNALGKRLLQLFFYRKLPIHLHNLFQEKYNISKAEVIQKVYNESRPNAYLASFAQFVTEHKSDIFIHENILVNELEKYVETHILPAFHKYHLPIYLIGSIAYYHQEIIQNILAKYAIPNANFIQKPIENLIEFHCKKLTTS